MPLRYLIILVFSLLATITEAADSGSNNRFTILAFGDSLTAGYGLAKGEDFPAQLEAILIKRGYPVRVINAGVSGDTTAGGLSRLDWALVDKPDLVIIELGANDALRGLNPAASKENLAMIISRIKERGIQPLLVGMKAPRNWGQQYVDAFDRIYPDLADEYKIPLYPFFLEGVATDPDLNQPDGLHPIREGVAVIVEKIVPSLLPYIPKQ